MCLLKWHIKWCFFHLCLRCHFITFQLEKKNSEKSNKIKFQRRCSSVRFLWNCTWGVYSETMLWDDLALFHSLEHPSLSAPPMMHVNIEGERGALIIPSEGMDNILSNTITKYFNFSIILPITPKELYMEIDKVLFGRKLLEPLDLFLCWDLIEHGYKYTWVPTQLALRNTMQKETSAGRLRVNPFHWEWTYFTNKENRVIGSWCFVIFELK